MAITISAGYNWVNGSTVMPSRLNQSQTGIVINCATGVLIGRTTAAAGAIEEITPGVGLVATAGGLSVGWADTNNSHRLRVACGSDLTADKTITITPGDSDRTITLSGNPTLGDWFDQSVKATASPTFATVTASLTGYVTGNVSGNAATATALQTSRTINGTGFDGTGNITVTAAAGTLSGTALNATVVTSSLTTVGALNAGSITSGFGSIDVGADSITGGAISGTTGTFTGVIATTATGSSFSRTGATTASVRLNIGNTGQDTQFGVESSTGGAVITGSIAYATVINSGASGLPVQIGVNSVLVGTFTATGLNNTVIGATTAVAGNFTAINGSGVITLTSTGELFSATGASIAAKYARFQNTGGDTFFGTDNSTGGIFSAGNYSTVLYSTTRFATSISGTVRTLVDATGLAVTGDVSTTTRFKTSTSVSSTTWGATGSELIANTTYGSVISGYGTTSDLALVNRAGGIALSVTANTVNLVAGGNFSVSGTLSSTGLFTGPDLLLTGTDAYINMNSTTGSGGYGIRNNAGTMEFKNSGGGWAAFSSGGTIAGGTGSTDNRIIRADGTGGATIQSSAVTIDDSGNITGVGTMAIGGALSGVTTLAMGGALSGVTTLAMSGALSGLTSIAMSTTLSGGTTCDFTTSYKVNGTKVLGAQSVAEADFALTTGGFSADGGIHAANYAALNGKLNSILAKIRTHGIFAP